MHQAITCLNGVFMPADKAVVPITNRGFRFGDGVFETIRLVKSLPYQWNVHLQRLNDGLKSLRIHAPDVNWAQIARELIKKNSAEDGFLRIIVTRGNASVGYLPLLECAPVWVMEYIPSRARPASPYALWLSSYARAPLSVLPANAKLAQGLGSSLALIEATEHECNEALQLTPNGLLCSAASANLFWVKNKTIFTPSLNTGCLNGTTRMALMRLSPYAIHEIEAELGILEAADAVFITNVNLGIMPISTLRTAGYSFNTNHLIIQDLQQALTSDYNQNTEELSKVWEL